MSYAFNQFHNIYNMCIPTYLVYIFLSIHSAIPARNESVPALGEKDVIVKIGVVNVPIYIF